jgi:hypothetical protein
MTINRVLFRNQRGTLTGKRGRKQGSQLLTFSFFFSGFYVLKMDPVVDLKHQRKIDNIVVLSNSEKQNSHHKNLNYQITSLYGREILDETRVLEKLRVKIKRRAADLDFLKRCRDNNVLPKFTCIEHKIKSKWNKTTFCTLGKSIVRGEIKKNRCALDSLSKTALKLHLKLAHAIHPDLWKKIDVLAALKAENANKIARARQGLNWNVYSTRRTTVQTITAT